MAEGGERLKYEVQLNKPGLTSDDFERLVKSKLQSVLKGKQNKTEKWYASKAKDIAGCFLLIQNKSNPDEIDKRRRSAERSADLIAYVKDSPSKIKSDQYGKRGTTKREKDIVKNYHEYQEDLFTALEKHYGIQKKENQTFSTINFCNNLDEILEHFLNMYFEKDKPTSVETTKNEREKLRAVFEISECILQLRPYGDMFIENDVLNMKHYEKWRDHVLVISSFAVLVCILNLLGEKLGGSFF